MISSTLTIPVYLNTTPGNYVRKNVTASSPLQYSRISKMYVTCADVVTKFGSDSTIKVNVANKEILPINFPLRWLCSDYYTGDITVNPELFKNRNENYSIEIDEPANGNQIDIEIYADSDILITFEFDNRCLNKQKTKFKVVTLQNSWSVQDSAVHNLSDNALRSVMNYEEVVRLDEPPNGIFAEYNITYMPQFNPNLIEYVEGNTNLRKYFEVIIPSHERTYFAIWLKDIDPSQLDTPQKELEQIKSLLKNTLLTVKDETKTIIKDIDLPLISPTRFISPLKSLLPFETEFKNIRVNTLNPVFVFSELDPLRINKVPFNSAKLQLCFTYKENR